MSDPSPDPRPFSWTRAVFPMAATPPAIAAALLVTGPFDPAAPLASIPVTVAGLLFLAAAGPALSIFTAHREIPDAVDRNRALTVAGVTLVAATAATAAIAMLLAKPLLVRGGGAWILLAFGAVAVSALASFAVLAPLERFRWGLLAGECVVAGVTVFFLGEPRAPDEFLRYVTTEAPGYGASSLGSLLPRRLLPTASDHNERHEARMRALDAALGRMLENGAFAPPYVAWGDDARVLRAFVASRAAASPAMSPEDSAALLRGAVRERMLFAGSPESRLEPWTKRGILVGHAFIETEGLVADEDTLIRVHIAWLSVIHLATVLEDRALEAEASGLVRKIFADEKLDRGHPILLATYSLERRRLVEAGDAPALLAFFDGLAAQDFPEPIKKSFTREAEFIRAHAELEYAPLLVLLKARLVANGGDGDLKAARALYDEVLGRWPGASVAPIARQERQELESG